MLCAIHNSLTTVLLRKGDYKAALEASENAMNASKNLNVRENELAELDGFMQKNLGIVFPRDLGFVLHREK